MDNKMNISSSPKHYNRGEYPDGCSDSYSSDFVAECNGDISPITIFATQPVYDYCGRLKLCDRDFFEEICYAPFEIKRVIVHDSKSKVFEENILRELKNLDNEEVSYDSD